MFTYFSSEYIERYSESYMEAKKKYQSSIEGVSSALDVIKKEAEGTVAYANYKNAKKAKDKAKESFYKIKKSERFFGFKSIWNFLYEFGPTACFFVVFLVLLFRSFYFERDNIGIKFLLGVMLCLLIFKFYWIFQPFQDISKLSYYLMTIFTATLIVLAVSLITKYQENYINSLKSKYLNLVKFTFINTKPEKKKEMLDFLEENSN